VTAESVVLRPCHSIEDFRSCVSLQKEVWNFTDAELVPLRMFVVADKVGGQVIGAFDGPEMIGFALSVPGTRSGHIYLHSHMLAVRKQYRNGGLGRRMKLMQREDAISRGIDLIEWTFDPLEIKNAYLNIEKLGAIARRYNINQYGITSSPLQGGLPSDRLTRDFHLRSRPDLCLERIRRNPRTRAASPGAQSRAVSESVCRTPGGVGLRARCSRQWEISAGKMGREVVVRFRVVACRLHPTRPVPENLRLQLIL